MALNLALVFISLLSYGLSSAVPQSDAAREILNIVNNPEIYSKDIRPYLSEDDPLQVEASLYISNMAVDDINMMVKVDLFFRMFWQDPRLYFDVEGVDSVTFTDVSKFWIPDVFARNALRTESSPIIGPESVMKISDEGNVIYSTRLVMDVKCNMDITTFPHDLQNCPINFESYGYETEEVVITFKDEDPINYNDELEIVRKFSLVEVSAGDYSSQTETGEYSGVEVNLSLQREFYPYFLEWYLPLMVYAGMAFLSLFVTDFFSRIFLSVVPLTTILASILYYSQNLPTVPYVTSIDVFTIVTVISVVCTLINAVVRNYNQINDIAEEKIGFEVNEKWRRVYVTLKSRSNLFTKLFIIGFYVIFLFAYYASILV